MNEHCIHIFSKDNKFRPSTPSPDKHWAYMLIDTYGEYGSIRLKWSPVPTITIEPTFWEHCDYGFEHVMNFIKMHNLDYTVDSCKCLFCKGHPSCVSTFADQPR